MGISTRFIEYTDNGQPLEGFLAWDDSVKGPLPGVLVSHAWAGRSQFECNKAVELAKLGFAAMALDLYGKGILGSGPDENTKLMQPFINDRLMMQTRMQIALNTLKSQVIVDSSRCGAIGFCFGGMCVLDLARSGADIQGVVSFHGLLQPPGNTEGNQIGANVLVLHGWEDPMVQPDIVVSLASELTQAGADWQIHGYGKTMHAFTNPEANDTNMGTVYNETADTRSWNSMHSFLEETLG